MYAYECKYEEKCVYIYIYIYIYIYMQTHREKHSNISGGCNSEKHSCE